MHRGASSDVRSRAREYDGELRGKRADSLLRVKQRSVEESESERGRRPGATGFSLSLLARLPQAPPPPTLSHSSLFLWPQSEPMLPARPARWPLCERPTSRWGARRTADQEGEPRRPARGCRLSIPGATEPRVTREGALPVELNVPPYSTASHELTCRDNTILHDYH